METFEYVGKDLEAMCFAENYHRWILDEIRPYIGKRVAEVGAGSGDFTKMLLETDVEELFAVEPSDEMFKQLAEKHGENSRLQAFNAFFETLAEEKPEFFDSALYINVLEHIEKDRDELAAVYRALKPGGHACIFVPALQWLYSDFDESIGHFRRYHKGPLLEIVEGAGFAVEHARFFDIAGIVPWYVAFTLMGGSLNRDEVSLYDGLVVPVMRHVERIVPKPFGKNLLVVGRKPEE